MSWHFVNHNIAEWRKLRLSFRSWKSQHRRSRLCLFKSYKFYKVTFRGVQMGHGWDAKMRHLQYLLAVHSVHHTHKYTHTHTHTHTHVSLLTVYIHRISQQTGQFVSLDVNAYRGAEYNWQCKFFGKFCRCLLLTAFCQLCGFLFSDKNFDIVSKNRKTVTNHYSLLLGWLKKIDTDFQNNKIQANSHLLLKYYLYCFKIERRYRQQLRIYFFLHAVYVQ